MGEYWLLYIDPYWAEYGNGKINMRSGLMPPLSGMVNNPYKDSCGAFIRSEIWACISPGCPEVAVRYAYEDAIVDHGHGEGMYAEIFCAAIESAAFVEKDTYKLINIGLSYIPEDCGVTKAVNCGIKAYKSGKSWFEARDEILSKYRGQFAAWAGISDEDREKGFADGVLGWDAPSNIGIIIIGWLYGEGDFGKSMCITVNCGEDTDCTAGTLGSIFGIIHGLGGIPQKWIEPIGYGIKVMWLNLGEIQGYLPADINDLTRRTERLAKQVALRYIPQVELSETKSTDLTDLKDICLFSRTNGKSVCCDLSGPVYRFDSFDVTVDYFEGPYIKDDSLVKVKIRIANKSKTPESVNLKWYMDDNWSIGSKKSGKVFIKPFGDFKDFIFELKSEKALANVNRAVLELTVDGKHTVMLVPVIFLNGNLS